MLLRVQEEIGWESTYQVNVVGLKLLETGSNRGVHALDAVARGIGHDLIVVASAVVGGVLGSNHCAGLTCVDNLPRVSTGQTYPAGRGCRASSSTRQSTAPTPLYMWSGNVLCEQRKSLVGRTVLVVVGCVDEVAFFC